MAYPEVTINDPTKSTLNFVYDGIQITAQSNAGYKFKTWEVDIITETKTINNKKYTFEIYKCTANFEKEIYKIKFSDISSSQGICISKVDYVEVVFDQTYTISATYEADKTIIMFNNAEIFICPPSEYLSGVSSNNAKFTIIGKSIKIGDLGNNGAEGIINIKMELKKYGIEVH